MTLTHNVPHLVTLVLWCFLLPASILLLLTAPLQMRSQLGIGLARFVFLSFLLFYAWNFTRGNNETLIDLFVRLYMAVDALVSALIIEHWHTLPKSGPKSAPGQGEGSANVRIVTVQPFLSRGKHLALTIILVTLYWAWLFYGFSQLHLR